MSLADVRDVVVVAFGIAGLVMLLVMVAWGIWLWLMYRRVRRGIERLRAESIQPTVDDVKASAFGLAGAGMMYYGHFLRPAWIAFLWWRRYRRARKMLGRVPSIPLPGRRRGVRG